MQAARITDQKGISSHLKRKFNPATTKAPMNIRRLKPITSFCSFSVSLALSLDFNRSGLLNIMTIPATNMGMNKIPMKIQPSTYANDHAGKNISAPTITTPAKNLIIACKSSFALIMLPSTA